jgi:hypothetical protein
VLDRRFGFPPFRRKDEVSVRDRNWVSSRKPDDIPQFNKNMIELFSEAQEKSREVA